MRNKLKCMLLLLPTLAIGSSLSGTPPYTAISLMNYMGPRGLTGGGIIVSDSVGNVFFSSQYGHNFSAAVSSGNTVGANFITPNSLSPNATLWYLGSNGRSSLPIEVTESYSAISGITISAAPSGFAPSSVGGVVRSVFKVRGLGIRGYNNDGAVVLANQGNYSSLIYYEINGMNVYKFNFFRHLSTAHMSASNSLLATTGMAFLYTKNLSDGTNNSTILPGACSDVVGGAVKFMQAINGYVYLICNKSSVGKNAMLYRYSMASNSFDAGQKFNPNDKTLNSYYRATSLNNVALGTGISPVVFVEQSNTRSNDGVISYINTCLNSQPLGSCQSQSVSGLSVGNVSNGIITKRMSAAGVLSGYAGLFVGNSNYILKVDLDTNGNYVSYTTY